MSLRDTAKGLREQAASPELRWLREMRAFTKQNTREALLRERDEIEAYSHTPEGSSPAGCERVCARMADLLERGALVHFYEHVLEYAERKERQEKGGGEKAIRSHRQEIERKEQYIKKKYRRQRRLQMRLEDLEGDADGDDETGNDPFAAGDGG